MSIIGLTGNFGMGKSTVLRLFNKLGALTYSADDFVHNILENQAIINKISEVLGKDVLIRKQKNVSLNKKKVANIIFTDPQKRRAVEQILHPEVLKAFKLSVSDILSKNPTATIIFEVPLLFEAGYENTFDKTVVVHCKKNMALTRLIKKGFSRDEALKRMRAQMSITEKKKLAHFLIDNNNSITNTTSQVKKIFKSLAHT